MKASLSYVIIVHHSFDHGHGQLATMKWPVQTAATSFDDKVLLAAGFNNANSLLSCMISICKKFILVSSMHLRILNQTMIKIKKE